MRRWWVRLLAVLAVVALLIVAAVFLVTNSDWGRERVRRYIVNLIQDNSHGIVHIGSVSGNLLNGVTLHDVVITDSARAPFVKADEIWAKYNLGTLRGKRIEFNNVKLVRPIIVLDRQPGANTKWNYERIFPRDTVTRTGVKKTGWGTWIRFSNVTVVDGDFTIRSPWDPGPVTPAERADKVRAALGPQGRLKILQVARGYQKESSFHRVNGLFPLVRLADPGYKTRLIDVAALKMIAEPFRPPVADVRGMTGTVEFTGDSVWWKGVRATFPGTRASGDGRYLMASGDLHLRLHGDPVRPADIRWAMPNLPENGSGKLDFGLDWTGKKSVYIARNMDVTLEGSHIAGQIEATVTDTIAYRDANLRFANLDTRLLTRLFPAMTFPRPLTLAGRAEFEGGNHSLRINGDVTVDDRLSGRSRLVGNGVMGLSEGIFTARGLRVRMQPLQMGLVRAIAPAAKLNGALSGSVTVNGSTAAIITAQGDVTHVERGAVSNATGRFAMRARGLPWFDVNARMHPLALATLGQFMPSVGLRGTASGPVRLIGSINNLGINTQLTFPDGGFLDLRGTMDLATRETGYNLEFDARQFNAGGAVAKAPQTSITAVGSARGRGTDPATMQAQIVADVAASTVDTVSLDSANVRVAIANGIARFDTLAVGLPQGIIEAKGTFGLAPGARRYAVVSHRDRLTLPLRGSDLPGHRFSASASGDSRRADCARKSRLIAHCARHRGGARHHRPGTPTHGGGHAAGGPQERALRLSAR